MIKLDNEKKKKKKKKQYLDQSTSISFKYICFLVFSTLVLFICTIAQQSPHYENLPMQYIQFFFSVVKNENFVGKILIFFLFLLKT